MKIILDHKTFFEKHGSETIPVGIHNALTVEMLYQMFKDRMIEEENDAIAEATMVEMGRDKESVKSLRGQDNAST